jgi:hypothetical protein
MLNGVKKTVKNFFSFFILFLFLNCFNLTSDKSYAYDSLICLPEFSFSYKEDFSSKFTTSSNKSLFESYVSCLLFIENSKTKNLHFLKSKIAKLFPNFIKNSKLQFFTSSHRTSLFKLLYPSRAPPK